MVIQARCSCGKVYPVGDEHAGKTFSCTACKAPFTVPQPPPPPPRKPAVPPPPPASKRPADGEIFLAPSYAQHAEALRLEPGERAIFFAPVPGSAVKSAAKFATRALTYGLVKAGATDTFFLATDRRIGVLVVEKPGGLIGMKKAPTATCKTYRLDQVFAVELVEDTSADTMEMAVRDPAGPALHACSMAKEHREPLRRLVERLRFLKGEWEEPPEPLTSGQKARAAGRLAEDRESLLEELEPAEREAFLQLEKADRDRDPKERIQLIRRMVSWVKGRDALLKGLPEKLGKEPLTLGILDPALEKMVQGNLDTGERLLVTMCGAGVDTLAATDARVIVILSQKDWEASNSGVGGQVTGGAAGMLAGDAVGTAIGDEIGGVEGMIVGGLLGAAAGLVAGQAVGKALTAQEVVDTVAIPIPYASITGITTGFRGNGEFATIRIVSTAEPVPVVFTYGKDDVDFGNALARMLRMSVEKAGTAQRLPAAPPTMAAAPHVCDKQEIVNLIKELGSLRKEGILTEEEFQEKKKGLLARL